MWGAAYIKNIWLEYMAGFSFERLAVVLGCDSGWDCARGISPPREHFPGPPLNSRAELKGIA